MVLLIAKDAAAIMIDAQTTEGAPYAIKYANIVKYAIHMRTVRKVAKITLHTKGWSTGNYDDNASVKMVTLVD